MNTMERHIGILGGIFAVLTAIVGTSVTIDSRYAKSEEVRQQFCQARKQQLRDRIFEIDLKASKTASDIALREYLAQQLKENCN